MWSSWLPEQTHPAQKEAEEMMFLETSMREEVVDGLSGL